MWEMRTHGLVGCGSMVEPVSPHIGQTKPKTAEPPTGPQRETGTHIFQSTGFGLKS